MIIEEQVKNNEVFFLATFYQRSVDARITDPISQMRGGGFHCESLTRRFQEWTITGRLKSN